MFCGGAIEWVRCEEWIYWEEKSDEYLGSSQMYKGLVKDRDKRKIRWRSLLLKTLLLSWFLFNKNATPFKTMQPRQA